MIQVIQICITTELVKGNSSSFYYGTDYFRYFEIVKYNLNSSILFIYYTILQYTILNE